MGCSSSTRSSDPWGRGADPEGLTAKTRREPPGTGGRLPREEMIFFGWCGFRGSRPDGFAYAVADVPTSRCVIEAMIRFGEGGGVAAKFDVLC